MSHHVLQQLVVRLLFDDEFVRQLYQNTDETLAGLDLTPLERQQLLAVDRRAWGYDTLRRRRTLRTLVEEFKVSTTIILAETRALAALERFFATAHFHRVVQERGSLGLAFAEFLLEGCRLGHWQAPQLPDIIRLETAIAGCRRAAALDAGQPPPALPEHFDELTAVQLAPGYALGSYQANVIAAIQHVEKYLFELSLMPAMALCDDAPRLGDLPPLEAQKKVFLLFGPGAAGIALTELDRASYLVLYETRRPVTLKALTTRLGSGSASARRAPAILAEWLEQGALRLALRASA